MAEITTYLITGANRGIGYALLKQLFARPNTRILAVVRDQSFPKPLPPSGQNSTISIYPLDITSQISYDNLVDLLNDAADIKSIDVVIANAGTHQNFLPITDTTPEELLSVFQANSIGPILLFQKLLPLMSKGKNGKEPGKFFVMSSVLGSIAGQEGKGEACLSYGISKCAANFFVRRAHCEHENLVCVALHPGWVQTAMGQGFADSLVGFNGSPPLDVNESVKGLLEQIDGATRENLGGKFVSYDRNIIPW